MYSITEKIVKLLETKLENITIVPDISGIGNYDNSNQVENIKSPSVFVYDLGFTADRMGIGNIGGTHDDIIIDEFDTSEKTLEFTLSKTPIKPLISVENPRKTMRTEIKDYIMDYKTNKIKFLKKPKTGKKNTVVKYYVSKDVHEISYLRLRIDYNFDVVSKKAMECDELVLKILKMLVESENELSKNEISLSFIRSDNTNKANSSNKQKTKYYSRKMVYQLETNIKMDTVVPRIKEISIQDIGE